MKMEAPPVLRLVLCLHSVVHIGDIHSGRKRYWNYAQRQVEKWDKHLLMKAPHSSFLVLTTNILPKLSLGIVPTFPKKTLLRKNLDDLDKNGNRKDGFTSLHILSSSVVSTTCEIQSYLSVYLQGGLYSTVPLDFQYQNGEKKLHSKQVSFFTLIISWKKVALVDCRSFLAVRAALYLHI